MTLDPFLETHLKKHFPNGFSLQGFTAKHEYGSFLCNPAGMQVLAAANQTANLMVYGAMFEASEAQKVKSKIEVVPANGVNRILNLPPKES